MKLSSGDSLFYDAVCIILPPACLFPGNLWLFFSFLVTFLGKNKKKKGRKRSH